MGGNRARHPRGARDRGLAPQDLVTSTFPTRRQRSALGYALLALLAYIPPLLTARGRVAADTKQYLYLDPGRLLSRSVSMWDPHIGMGTVTHQTIGYAFPMGPYYWLLEKAVHPRGSRSGCGSARCSSPRLSAFSIS